MNDLKKLLVDPNDLAELLEAYGEPIPGDPAERRRRALELTEVIPREDLIADLVRHATGFARMVKDVEEFCVSLGATINGRIQIRTADIALQFEGLSSGWAFDGPSDWKSAEQRALALAEELRYLTESFDPERATGSREHLTRFGKSIQGSIYADVLRGSETHRRETTVREADLDQIGRILSEVEDARLQLRNAELAPAVSSALDLAASNLKSTRDALARHAKKHGGTPSEVLIGLHSSLAIVLSQLVALVAETSAGRRVHRERSDFLRTELWKQRWRVYELWVLVRVLAALRHAGGRLDLHGVLPDGVWELPYGHAEAPVATCHIGDDPLDVYYQLHVRTEHRADMPDIAVIGAQTILVLDPKHGTTITRSKVQTTLSAYAKSFNATLTAVVNYYPISTYQFDLAQQGDKRWLLASGIAPGSPGVQRLELLIRDAVLAAGHVAHSKSKSTFSTPRAPAQTFLTYYASQTVEVDEEAGFWAARAGRGPERLSGLEGIVGDPKKAFFNEMHVWTSLSADVWIIRRIASSGEETTWKLHEGGPPIEGDTGDIESHQCRQRNEETSPSGRYCVRKGPNSLRNGVLLLTVRDNVAETPLPLIRFHGEFPCEFLWAPDESAVAFRVSQGDERRLMVARLGDRHASPVSLPGQDPTGFGWMTAALLRSIRVRPT